MKSKEIKHKLMSVLLYLMAHPDNEIGSECEDRICDLQKVLPNITNYFYIKQIEGGNPVYYEIRDDGSYRSVCVHSQTISSIPELHLKNGFEIISSDEYDAAKIKAGF